LANYQSQLTSLMSCMQSSSCVADAQYGGVAPEHTFAVPAVTPDACFYRSCQSQYDALVAKFGSNSICGSVALSVSSLVVMAVILAVFMF
jgi:hypothetical protein